MKTTEKNYSESEYANLDFQPRPGSALVEVKKEAFYNICGVLMPQEKGAEDSQLIGTIVSITPGEDSTYCKDFYKLGDTVCFKEWSGSKLPLGRKDRWLVALKDLGGKFGGRNDD